MCIIPLDHLLVLRTLILLGTVRAGMVVGTVNPTRTRENSGRRQGVRPVVVILLREVAEVAQAVVEAVAVTTALPIPPLREPLEVCPPPGAI